jgi:glycosyltransferase involved in cell wall biosynthesis
MLSVIILTKNEEENILDCLETVGWADEIIIVDDYSEDRTVEIVKAQNLKNLTILKRELVGDFAKMNGYYLLTLTKGYRQSLDKK